MLSFHGPPISLNMSHACPSHVGWLCGTMQPSIYVIHEVSCIQRPITFPHSDFPKRSLFIILRSLPASLGLLSIIIDSMVFDNIACYDLNTSPNHTLPHHTHTHTHTHRPQPGVVTGPGPSMLTPPVRAEASTLSPTPLSLILTPPLPPPTTSHPHHRTLTPSPPVTLQPLKIPCPPATLKMSCPPVMWGLAKVLAPTMAQGPAKILARPPSMRNLSCRITLHYNYSLGSIIFKNQ